MLKINRKTRIKYRKIFEEYLFKKYSSKISPAKYPPRLLYRKTQLKMF
jgi:hypothetical protein